MRPAHGTIGYEPHAIADSGVGGFAAPNEQLDAIDGDLGDAATVVGCDVDLHTVASDPQGPRFGLSRAQQRNQAGEASRPYRRR